ncbi:6-phosphofructokinase [Flavobacterium sp. xlx-214]|uniref:6-phosphofructokinase n=1 Tax=unclassified Flavobacterium TaxID=196869 RepID=UPI0013D2F3E8|nr:MULTISPECIES: 6-phosphofructokinase [unclassified Flavobacterium]MBA5793540.1 6-phosphofructokinase [Flavobacterium sp. xlx-221]QMI82691.1 6-phosphofructokinase [Flavobacterium sp. xlx-214]
MNTQKIKKIAVLTSGGDAPGMNAAIRAVVRACTFYEVTCFGVFRGFQGLIENDMKDMGPRDVKYIISKGGTILKSARSKEFETKDGREKAYQNIKQQNIDALIVIGGDGSFRGALALSNEFGVPVIGIPGTIDNDIFGTSHTLGYDTALNTVIDAVDKIRDTATSHKRIFFVEVMGRDAGFIALNSGIGAGAEEILIPEENIGLPKLLEKLKRSKSSGKSSCIVIVAEGEKSGKNVFELSDYVEENLPEYDVRVSVIGHIQRGGSPSCFDRVLASQSGVAAVEALLKGHKNVMIGMQNDTMAYTPLEKAVKGKAKIDEELIRISDILSI